MNPERLLAHYERIADAPDAIARLRRFILDLAVRGKLVPQDPDDEPASELLKRIAEDKAERAVSARDRRATSIEPLIGDAVPSLIPSTWIWASFGDITISRDGERVPVSREERDQKAKVYDYYGASGVIDKIDAYLFDKPLLLIGEDGANLINRSTPIAFIARGHYWVNNHAHVLDGLSEEFLQYVEMFINATDLKPYVTGTAQPKMNQAKMNSIPVALPPLAEQHRIVAKVDELMALCDRLEAARAEREKTRDRLTAASLARLNAPDPDPVTFAGHARFALDNLTAFTTRPDQIKQLRQTILNLAVRGKLVPQDPNDEPTSELLKRIAKEKARAGKRETVETEIDNEQELGELPPTWHAVPLIALGSWAIGCGFPKNEQGLESGPHFFLKVSDMNLPGNEKYITTSNNFIDDDAARRMRAKIHPPGTVIFPKIGGAIATNKRRILTRGSAIDNNCLGITFSSALNIEWSYLLLTTLDFTRYQAGTAVPALQQGVLERIPVGLPPLAEQQRIVAKVDELMALCDRLEASLVATAATRRRLLDALVAEALGSAPAEARAAAAE